MKPARGLRMGMDRWVGLLVITTAFACGGRAEDPPLVDEGLQGPANPSSDKGCEHNPNGFCYPTKNVGLLENERIPNFKLLGYRATSTDDVVDMSATQVISLADFYDPDHSLGISLIHVSINTEWCSPSNEEVDFMSGSNYTGANVGGYAFAKELAPLGVVFLEVLVDGPIVGQPATITDLQNWVTHHQINFNTAVDGNYANFGGLFTAAAIPFNINIDARSMQILDRNVGFDTEMDIAIKKWLAWQSITPAMQ